MNKHTVIVTRIIAVFACALLIGAAGFAYASSSSKDKNSNSQKKTNSSSKMNKQEKISYAFGYQIGKNFKSQNVKINPDVMAEGIRAGMGKQDSKLSKEQVQKVLQQFQQQMMAKMKAKREAEAKTNAAESKKFLEKNSKKEGIKVTDSGLQYKVIKKGSGDSPKDKDTVTVKYKGTLPDGTVFDDSKNHGGTATFEVDKVISGWTQALKMMHPGAKWRVWIPSDLAYGERGTNGGKIGPNQALVFDIELVKVEKSDK